MIAAAVGLANLGFLNPWALLALGALPALYWLLRTVPPQPRTIAFPPTRLLKDLENQKQTPARTPWWLMLIRMLAAACVILALADPVLNARKAPAGAPAGPLVIAIDNDWSTGATWSQRTETAKSLISDAERASQLVLVAPTAHDTTIAGFKLEGPAAARETMAAVRPQPFAPKRVDTIAMIAKALGAQQAARVVWLAGDLDHGDASVFLDGLVKAAGGAARLTVITGTEAEKPLGLTHRLGTGGKLIAEIRRAEGGVRGGTVQAWSNRHQLLAQIPYRFSGGELRTEATFDIPLELRNQVTRIDLAGIASAGGVSLLDSRSRWHRVGLIAPTSREQAQPLLSPIYYLERALAPFAELAVPKEADVLTAFDNVLLQNASTICLADVGTLSGQTLERAKEWVAKGGVLVRFAGPRLEKASDSLLPAPLRLGGRVLGGALSWGTPAPLSAFEADSLFAGLSVPADVTISRQVLTDPGRLGPEVKVWARLSDGTPLVTAARRGEGWVVLFHITANSDWSNLPLSGLFVDMMRRVTALGSGSASSPNAATKALVTSTGRDEEPAEGVSADALAPVETLNGFGDLRSPPVTAKAIRASAVDGLVVSADHPPGFYGPASLSRALNVITPKTVLAPLPALPFGALATGYQQEKTRALKPEFLTMTLALLFFDIAAVLALQFLAGGLRARTGLARRAAQAGLVVLIAAPAVVMDISAGGDGPRSALAQKDQASGSGRRSADDVFAIRSAGRTQLAYVITGEAATDQTSLTGLQGLNALLQARTAFEPGEPQGIDVDRDELAFFPLLYWPVNPAAKALSEKTLARIDAYMKEGGLIVFDTRDYGQAVPSLIGQDGPGGQALQRLIGTLDIPRLEPVPEGHVLTKSFYLMRTFPGRWDGGQMWVEAQTEAEKADPRRARRADGVSSILITSNDLASAWAIDSGGRPLFPVVPGGELQREMAYRTGVNIVMYALTGNYKADQVHIPALLERLGQ